MPIRNRADSLFWNPSVENRIIGDIDNWISKSNFRRHNSWRKEAWLITLLKDLKMRRYFINFQVLGCVFCIVKPCILWALVSQNCLISQKWVEIADHPLSATMKSPLDAFCIASELRLLFCHWGAQGGGAITHNFCSGIVARNALGRADRIISW